MTAPDRIAAYWTAAGNDTMPSQMLPLTPKSPLFHDDMPKSQRIEYVRADLVDPAAIREAALREAAAVATERWTARREHADHLAELDYPEAMIDAKTVSAKADEAEMIAEQILALIQKGTADDLA